MLRRKRHGVAVFQRQSSGVYGKDVAWATGLCSLEERPWRCVLPMGHGSQTQRPCVAWSATTSITGERLPSAKMMPALAPHTRFQPRRRLRGAAVGGLIISLISATTADAAGMIRDAETETLLKIYSKPIFAAAGLTAQGVDIHIINDRAFNAVVVDGHNMFMHAGALMDAKTPNQIIGVIAHECRHITGGHLARLRNQISKAKSAALMLQLLGLAAMAAGAAVGAGN